MPAQKNNSRLSREMWLSHALERLEAEGIQAVRVERLARELGVTKGSFYWHFNDLPDLKTSILEYWGRVYTDVVIENSTLLELGPSDGLLALMYQVHDNRLARYELPVRDWANHDPDVERLVKRVYGNRKRFVGSFFERMGFQGPEAEARTQTALCLLVWEPAMYPSPSKARRRDLIPIQHRLLVQV